jgi:hypothetical protein
MEESTIDLLKDALQKLFVFESSTLANAQYDIQNTFKIVEVQIGLGVQCLPW